MMLDTLARVKARLGITTTDYDTFLTQQITLATEAINGYCGRIFNEQTYIQTFYGDELCPSNEFFLFHYPVSEVEEFKEDTIDLDEVEFRIHKETGRIKGIDCKSFFSPRETEVKFKAGYAEADMPAVLLSVLDSIVGERYTKKINGIDLNFGTNVQRISIPGSLSIDFDYTLTTNERKSAYGAIIGNNANLLDPYRSERAVVGSDVYAYVEVSA